MYACVRGDEAMVQMLLDAGADINSEVSDDEVSTAAILVQTLGKPKSNKGRIIVTKYKFTLGVWGNFFHYDTDSQCLSHAVLVRDLSFVYIKTEGSWDVLLVWLCNNLCYWIGENQIMLPLISPFLFFPIRHAARCLQWIMRHWLPCHLECFYFLLYYKCIEIICIETCNILDPVV